MYCAESVLINDSMLNLDVPGGKENTTPYRSDTTHHAIDEDDGQCLNAKTPNMLRPSTANKAAPGAQTDPGVCQLWITKTPPPFGRASVTRGRTLMPRSCAAVLFLWGSLSQRLAVAVELRSSLLREQRSV